MNEPGGVKHWATEGAPGTSLSSPAIAGNLTSPITTALAALRGYRINLLSFLTKAISPCTRVR